jgi:threonine synthase
MWRGVIDEYRERLPIEEGVQAVTLGEGNTPLVEAPRVADQIGFGGRLLLKYEGLNPTASFKDRGMTVAISVAAASGCEAVICASTGNTSASGAAYAARAGMKAIVIIPEGRIALGKLSQALAHGATVVSIDGNFDQAMKVVTELTRRCNVVVVNSINPYRIQGQKTAAFEICDVLGAGVVTSRPRMMGFQAAGADPIVRGRVIENPETVATAIRIGNPASWKTAEAARDQSGGIIESVTDEEILVAYSMLASGEGVFVEPASAASLAGLRKVCDAGGIEDTATVVCTLTGHGLKDPATATHESPEPISARADAAEIIRLLKL